MVAERHRAKKRFGQNFLIDESIIQEIINLINPKPGDRIIEIGPGQAALTRPLLSHVEKLHVIEIDRDLVKHLNEKINNTEKLIIHETDVLKFNFTGLGEKPLRIIGNLPYNISSPLLFYLLNFSEIIDDMIFMLQNEVADRICANPGGKQYGRLSIMLQMYSETEKIFTIGPEAFSPSPKVNSAIVRLKPLTKPRYEILNRNSLSTIIQAAFSQRRKTIRNALKAFLEEAQLLDIGVDPQKRPENLDLECYARIANYYFQQN